MALDNGKETRRPHSQEDVDRRQRELEDKIVNDEGMKEKLMAHAMDRRIPGGVDVSEGGQQEQSGVRPPVRQQRMSGSDHSAVSGDAAKSEAGMVRRTVSQDGPVRTGLGSTDSSRNGAARREASGRMGERTAGRSIDTPLRASGDSGRNGNRRTAAGNPLRIDGKASVRTLNDTSEVERDIEFERKMRDKKKKAVRTRIIIMAVVEILTLACIFGFGSVYRYMNMTQAVEFDVSKVQNNNIDITQKQKMSGYWTVAVFGVDSRDGGVGKGANADVQIICNVDMATGDVKLVSVYRDTYLKTGSSTRYAKINEAYAIGGPEQAVAALNSNLDLDIQNYVTFNWKAVADTIDMLGGVDIDITDKEFYYMNAYIHETSVKAGINEKNPAANYIKKAGPQHLTGVQAVAYARLRYMDSDFERTRRQREVISQCLDNAKKADLATLTSIIDTVLPQVAFNIDAGDIVELAKGISRYNIKESVGFPKDIKDQMMGKKGDCVIPVTLTSNVKWLHSVLFDDEDYKVSSAVETYSQKIADDSGYYASKKDEIIETTKSKSTDEAEESDEGVESESKSSKKTVNETDKDGYIISGTDADGNTVYETDADGNKVKSTDKSKSKSDKSETEESPEVDEDEEVETDENGETIETSKSSKESGSKTSESESEETKSGKDKKETESSEKETKSSSKSEETTSGEVIEPGLIEEDDDSGAGPSGGSGSSSADSGGPGSITSMDEISEGPGGSIEGPM
ncbi:LCP family protein [Oribacterium sp. WCC10]|uniref:LCP family protein n=1 Tax=Oribacterium sp. WCC10 TaxID=1855343 RepID=UPI0008ED5385|nr:LCP family protein [Oribacterium sp. WCC10]SFG36499.1 cell envelope-related function transcriptional attenuator common domain-containing protein [Oribacterium sp. WCC10]